MMRLVRVILIPAPPRPGDKSRPERAGTAAPTGSDRSKYPPGEPTGMTDHADDGGHGDHHDHESGRSTAPQSPYTNREVGIGLAITLAGIVLVFAVPILLA